MAEFSLAELARLVGGTVVGKAAGPIRGVAGIEEAGGDEIAFLANRKYGRFLDTTGAGAVVVGPEIREARVPIIRVENPDLAFARIAERFAPEPLHVPPGVHPSAVIDPTAHLGAKVAIGPLCVVGAGASLGDRTVCVAQVYVGPHATLGRDVLLHPGVVVRERVRIGDRVICHAGSVIGSDGFGFAEEAGGRTKIPQMGTVEIGSDVSIGANSTVDRARFGVTRIGRGTKIDNLVQVAHNVQIGENGVLCAQVGISGSTRIGREVLIGGQAGAAGHVEIGDRARIAGGAGVTKAVPAGSIWSGYPAHDHRTHLREDAALARLPALLNRLRGRPSPKKDRDGRISTATHATKRR